MKKNILCMAMLLLAVTAGARTLKQGNAPVEGSTEKAAALSTADNYALRCEQDSIKEKSAPMSVSDLLNNLRPALVKHSDCTEPPQLPDGQDMNTYVNKHINWSIMEEQYLTQGDKGRLVIGYIVEDDGAISNVKVEHSFKDGFDQKVARTIERMKNLKPGKVNGKTVRVKETFTINIKL